MANIWEKAISILAGNSNSGRSYLITTVLIFWTKWTNVTGCSAQSLPEKVPHGTLGERLALADPLLQWLWKTTTSRRWPKVPTITKIRDIFFVFVLYTTVLSSEWQKERKKQVLFRELKEEIPNRYTTFSVI